MITAQQHQQRILLGVMQQTGLPKTALEVLAEFYLWVYGVTIVEALRMIRRDAMEAIKTDFKKYVDAGVKYHEMRNANSS